MEHINVKFIMYLAEGRIDDLRLIDIYTLTYKYVY